MGVRLHDKYLIQLLYKSPTCLQNEEYTHLQVKVPYG